MNRRSLELVADMAGRWHDRAFGGQSCTPEMTRALAEVRRDLRANPPELQS